MRVIVIGQGKPAYFLSKEYLAKGYSVTIINPILEECVRFSKRMNAAVVHGDGSDPGLLKEAGATGADILISALPNDQDNLVACRLASILFEVPRAVALVNDPENEQIFKKLGVTCFSTTQTISRLIAQRASLEEATKLIPASEGKVNITELVLRSTSPVVGRHLYEIVLPENALVGVIVRDGEPIVPRGPSRLPAGDRLV